jgi:serine/threonine protein kinase
VQPSSPRFKVLSVSPHPWERDAIEFLRDELPDADPIRVWALFEFVSHDGIVSEIDALVLSAKGFFLVEIKSTPGRLSGDNGTWTWTRPDGGRHSVDNPLLATNRKCKRLADLLRRHLGSGGQTLPYLQPLVFLSATELDVQLEPSARQHVCIRDRKRDDGSRSETRIPGIVAALTQSIPGEARPTRGPAIDKPLANAIARALEKAGIRESRRARRFGSLRTQAASRRSPRLPGLARRARLPRPREGTASASTPPRAMPQAELRQTYARAARREFTVLRDVSHPGILPALEFHDEDRGPGIVFPYDEKAQRLDHFVRDHGASLTLDQRIAILRGIAEALQYAHEKQLVHRALSPLSVLVRRREGGRIDTQLVDWQAASRNPLSTSSAYRASSTIHVHELVAPGAAPYLAPEHQLEANESGEQLDVFGLGAIAYLLFANEAPAADHQLARERLRQDDGFLLSAKVDASAPELIELIRDSTRPEVTSRYASIAEFNAQLDKVVDALTRPIGQRFHDPTAAEVGEILEGGWKIVRRLGKGSSAVVFLVERQTERRALKLALDPSKNPVLDAEAQVLKSLRHSAVVACREVLEFDGHRALLLDPGGRRDPRRAPAQARPDPARTAPTFRRRPAFRAPASRRGRRLPPRHQAGQHRRRSGRARRQPAPDPLRLLAQLGAHAAGPGRHARLP